MSAEINTRGFNKEQWEIFYQIKNLEFRRDKLQDEINKKYPDYKPASVNAELVRFTWRIKRNRAALIELTAKIENNSQGGKKICY